MLKPATAPDAKVFAKSQPARKTNRYFPRHRIDLKVAITSCHVLQFTHSMHPLFYNTFVNFNMIYKMLAISLRLRWNSGGCKRNIVCRAGT